MIDLLVESIYVLIFQACLSDNKSPWEENDIYLSPESYKEHSQMLKLIFEKVYRYCQKDEGRSKISRTIALWYTHAIPMLYTLNNLTCSMKKQQLPTNDKPGKQRKKKGGAQKNNKKVHL